MHMGYEPEICIERTCICAQKFKAFPQPSHVQIRSIGLLEKHQWMCVQLEIRLLEAALSYIPSAHTM